MLTGQGHAVMYRPLHLSPRQGALLGLVWIAVQKNREQREGASVEEQLLRDLVFTAQSRGLIDSAAHFRFDGPVLPERAPADLRMTLEELQKQGLLYVPETGGMIGFLGTSFFDLPTGVFRYLNVFGVAELVEEFTTGGDRD